MASESETKDPVQDQQTTVQEIGEDQKEIEEQDEEEIEDETGATASSSKGKRKSKKGKSKMPITSGMAEEILEMNPALRGEVPTGKGKAAEALKKLNVAELLTGMVCC